MACLLRTQGVRNLLPHFAFGKTGRTGAPQSAAKKISVKVQLCRTFTPLPAPPRRGLVRRADERGLSPPVSSEPGAYLRGTASPLDLAQLRKVPVNARLRAVQHLGHLAYCAL